MTTKPMICCIGFLFLLLSTPLISAVHHIVSKDINVVEKKVQKPEAENLKRSLVWFLWYIAYITSRFGIFQIISTIFSSLAYRLADQWNLTACLPPA